MPVVAPPDMIGGQSCRSAAEGRHSGSEAAGYGCTKMEIIGGSPLWQERLPDEPPVPAAAARAARSRSGRCGGSAMSIMRAIPRIGVSLAVYLPL